MDKKTKENGVYPVLDRDSIKYMAMAAMLLNHIANVFLTSGTLLFEIFVDIGYFTAITMCYFLVEGYRYTHSRKKYKRRLLLFAVISQIPYNLALSGDSVLVFTGFNMLFTLYLCFLIIETMDQMPSGPVKAVTLIFLILLTSVCDWALFAPVFTILFYLWSGSRKKMMGAYGIAALLFFGANFASLQGIYPPLEALLYSLGACVGILLSGVVILCFYSGEQRSHGGFWSKWFFYIFYPAHLLVLGVLRLLLL